jgi:hypothetical protein
VIRLLVVRPFSKAQRTKALLAFVLALLGGFLLGAAVFLKG